MRDRYLYGHNPVNTMVTAPKSREEIMTTFTIELYRRNVTPAQFLAYVRRMLKVKGGTDYCGCLDLDYFKAGSEPNYDTTRDGVHTLSRSKPYEMQTYIKTDNGYLYNEICEFEFDDEKTGYGYYYLINVEPDEDEATRECQSEEDTERCCNPADIPVTIEVSKDMGYVRIIRRLDKLQKAYDHLRRMNPDRHDVHKLRIAIREKMEMLRRGINHYAWHYMRMRQIETAMRLLGVSRRTMGWR